MGDNTTNIILKDNIQNIIKKNNTTNITLKHTHTHTHQMPYGYSIHHTNKLQKGTNKKKTFPSQEISQKQIHNTHPTDQF